MDFYIECNVNYRTRLPETFLEHAIARLDRAPDPDRQEEQFYNYFSEIWADGYEQGLAQQHAAYLPYLPKVRDLPFLDIGCGAGEFIQFLSTHGMPAQGIDSNATKIVRAKERGLNDCCADALSYLHEHHECFSGISLTEVTEHIPPESMAFNTFYTDPTHTSPMPLHSRAYFSHAIIARKHTKVPL